MILRTIASSALVVAALAIPRLALADAAPVPTDIEACMGSKAGAACTLASASGTCTELSDGCGAYGPTCLSCVTGDADGSSGTSCAMTIPNGARHAAGWACALAFAVGLFLVGRRQRG